MNVGPIPDLPVVAFAEVFHVGTLNEAERKDASHEGDGVSVSLHPDDWISIARLGRGPVWSFDRADDEPLRFLDWHNLTSEQRDGLRTWGASQGWVTRRQVYNVLWEDEDWPGETIFMPFDSEDEARYEAEGRDDARIQPATAWRPTDTFPEARIDADVDPSDILAALYVREYRPDLDGVWWEDTYAPELLSCPRGVLVHDLGAYERRRVS